MYITALIRKWITLISDGVIDFTMRFLFALTITLLLSGCYKNESTITDSLIYCSANYPQSFNPQISHDIATLDATTHQLYNRLVKIDPINKGFIPDLATHWQESDDKLSFTFFLRKNVHFQQTTYFSPRRDFNADDVIFSFQRMKNKDNPFHTVNRVTNNYFFNHPFTNLVSEIIKIDDYTVKFMLNKPDVTLLANLAAHYGVILSQEYAQQLISRDTPEQIDFYPVGTGPYKFKNSDRRTGITRYLAHAGYWQGSPAIQTLIFDVTSDNSKRHSKLLSGECDIITTPAPSQLNKIGADPHLRLSTKATENVALLAFNSLQKPFDQQEIRRAFSYAIDQKTIIDAIFSQSATATNGLLAKQSWAYSPLSDKLQYSPELAKNMLEQSHFDFSKTISILTPIENTFFNPSFNKTAELIKASLLEIGVRSEIIPLAHSELEKRLASANYDTYLTGINVHIDDPDSLFRPLLSCDSTILQGNASRWCSKQVQDLLDSSLSESNFVKRVMYYYQLQAIVQEERPYYPIAHLLRIDAFNRNISGFLVNPLTGIDFQNVRKIEAH